MTDQEIIQLLDRTGHLGYPFGKPTGPGREPVRQEGVHVDGVGNLQFLAFPLDHPDIEKAIASYQDFMIQNLDPLVLRLHARPFRSHSGIGPATRELMEQPRCGCPDYGPDVQPAVGTGSWKRCHDIGEFHAATVFVHKDGMPSFLEPKFDEIWDRNVAAYDEIGLHWIRKRDATANIDFSFVSRSNGWIGLAIVGRSQSCGSQIWCKYLSRYQPSNVVREWATLVMHELGHNAGLQHTRGGVMNPGIINGLPASWKGDPAESILKRYYGGEPIKSDPEGDEYWVKQCFESNRGRKVCVPLIPPQPVEEEFYA